MTFPAQNTSSSAIHFQGQSRRPLVRVNMHISHRLALQAHAINNRHRKLRLRSCHSQRLCKTSRDPAASLKAKRVARLSSMTSQERDTTCNGNTISLPRILPRPPHRPIQIEALRSACPELDDVSDSFVRTHLASMAPRYVSLFGIV